MAARTRAALPPLPAAAMFSLLWGALLAASAILWLFFHGWRAVELIFPVAAVFFIGGLLSWLPARLLSRLVAPEANSGRRIAADLLFHATAAAGLTAVIFALAFRFYYAQWHGDLFSVFWIYNFVFTILAAIYQFLVLGLRMMAPGLAFALALYIARLAGPRR